MSKQSFFRYPLDPPACQRSGAACKLLQGNCPSNTTPERCNYLQLGIERVQDKQKNLENRYDDILPGFFTSRGIRDEINSNNDLFRELSEGHWGLLYCDLRGLKGTNERVGKKKGDQLLSIAARRFILEAGIRTQDIAVPDERREESQVQDIGIRDNGADELMAIIRQVDKTQFDHVEIRQHSRFSISRAIKDSRDGLTPTILSFAGVHASEMNSELLKDPAQAFETMKYLADERHLGRKGEQDNAMWTSAFEAAADADVALQKPKDSRGIADLFMKWCCPYYFQYEQAVLERDDRQL